MTILVKLSICSRFSSNPEVYLNNPVAIFLKTNSILFFYPSAVTKTKLTLKIYFASFQNNERFLILMIVKEIILAYLLYQYVISWEFWSFPTFSFMFWITHSSYSILPPWLDAIMGKQTKSCLTDHLILQWKCYAYF